MQVDDVGAGRGNRRRIAVDKVGSDRVAQSGCIRVSYISRGNESVCRDQISVKDQR